MPTSWRPQLRAVAITVALTAHLIYALPLPRPLTDRDLEKEWRQDQYVQWQELLGRVGVEVATDDIAEFLRDWTGFWGGLHDTLKTPFKPVFHITGTNQRWALFATATEKPERVVVTYQDAGGEWHTLLRRLDPPYTWREHQLRYRRLRGIWDGVDDKPKVAYRNLTRWIAGQVFAEYPDAVTVKVHLERQFSTLPWEEDDPRIKVRVARQHHRDAP